MEGVCLGLFMISAFAFGTILEHPVSPVHQAIPNQLLRRLLMGLAMGLTAIAIIYSPWGKQSGAHINPSTTLTFFRLGKVGGDAFGVVARSGCMLGAGRPALMAISPSLTSSLPLRANWAPRSHCC
jgi:glycerol uptake facilitator-like aquaporin